ncbi:GNAT family N-acetyltransferase [Paenibacillus albus]
MLRIDICRVERLEDYDLTSLLTESEAEGFRHIRRFVNEYLDGSNRFDLEGEVLFLARVNGLVAGVGGLNREMSDKTRRAAGRVRRVYVASAYRRQGVARALMKAILEHAENGSSFAYDRLVLRCGSSEADLFYRSLGFQTVEGNASITHELLFNLTSEEEQLMDNKSIQHMVIFDLKHSAGSAEAEQFLKDGQRLLTSIPVVRSFQVFNQVSAKNDYQYGFSMVFDNQADYEAYNAHPVHVDFVEGRWVPEVARFLEIDFKNYGG